MLVKTSCSYFLQGMHAEDRPIVGLDGFDQIHVFPDAYVPSWGSWEDHLLCPAIHSTHHCFSLPHVSFPPNKTSPCSSKPNAHFQCTFQVQRTIYSAWTKRLTVAIGMQLHINKYGMHHGESIISFRYFIILVHSSCEITFEIMGTCKISAFISAIPALCQNLMCFIPAVMSFSGMYGLILMTKILSLLPLKIHKFCFINLNESW